MSRSYESLRAELDEIVESYRSGRSNERTKGTLTRDEAAKRIRKLGFTAADAKRWLDSKLRHR
jgi:hypothetical protein